MLSLYVTELFADEASGNLKQGRFHDFGSAYCLTDTCCYSCPQLGKSVNYAFWRGGPTLCACSVFAGRLYLIDGFISNALQKYCLVELTWAWIIHNVLTAYSTSSQGFKNIINSIRHILGIGVDVGFEQTLSLMPCHLTDVIAAHHT